MVLTEDAVHSNGRVLLKSGAVLEQNHLKIFKVWGITSVSVESNEDNQSPPQKQHSPDDIKRVIAQKKKAFRHCDLKHPFINELFRSSVKMTLEHQR